jgi:hypothetical protein
MMKKGADANAALDAAKAAGSNQLIEIIRDYIKQSQQS